MGTEQVSFPHTRTVKKPPPRAFRTYAANIQIEEGSTEQGDILGQEIAAFDMALKPRLVDYTKMMR